MMHKPHLPGPGCRGVADLNIWLVRDLEPLPTDPGDRRLMRAGMLAEALARRGHATTWFTSSFDLYKKRQRIDRDQTLFPQPNLIIEVFRGRGYGLNVSLGRIVHNRGFAERWRRRAEASAVLPDVIVTDIPTTEAAEAVMRFAGARGIPTVLSIRDLWPDFFVDYLPALLKPIARPFVAPLDRQARYAAAHATSLLGISDDYLAWGRAKGDRSHNELDCVFPLGYAARPLPDDAAVAPYREQFGLGDKAIISFVGSWGRTYDLELVRMAAEKLAGRTDIAFVVAGDKDTQPALRDAFARLPNVTLAGWLSADEIALLLSASAIGLLPYQPNAPQGLPNKVFEYMAYGVWQLATLEGEIGRFYAETGAGQVVGRDLAPAITAALPLALDPTKRLERIALFERRYSADAVYGGMVEHIERVAALSRRPPGSAPRS
jgi:colanic acid biosynthesis glycosyl transferase WcaI